MSSALPFELLAEGSRYEVHWLDSERVDLGWSSPRNYVEALNDRSSYATVGYFLRQSDDHLLLVMNRSPDGTHVCQGMIIPKSLVTKIVSLSCE